MSDFHPETIAKLRNELKNWHEQLENAESELKFREDQATKARELTKAAQRRVADYERLLAVVETKPADAYAEYFPEQIDGLACISCAVFFDEGQPKHPVNTVSHGRMFAHANPDDCKAVTR